MNRNTASTWRRLAGGLTLVCLPALFAVLSARPAAAQDAAQDQAAANQPSQGQPAADPAQQSAPGAAGPFGGRFGGQFGGGQPPAGRGGRGARGGRGGRGGFGGRGGRAGAGGGGGAPGPQQSQGEEPTLPRVETMGSVPSDAIVIFDGTSTDMLVGPNGEPCSWPVIDGVLYVDTISIRKQDGLWTKLNFGAAQVHAEVYIPQTGRSGQDAGNSGFYFHGLIEMQILDTYNNRTSPITGIGAIYNIFPPLVNAARPPNNWHIYDIIYHPPKRDASGEPVENGSMTVLLNGVLVQDNTPILQHVSQYAPLNAQRTQYAQALRENVRATEVGPLQLQNHENAVGFRNIWIRPLDNRAFVFDINKPLPQRSPESLAQMTAAAAPTESQDQGAVTPETLRGPAPSPEALLQRSTSPEAQASGEESSPSTSPGDSADAPAGAAAQP